MNSWQDEALAMYSLGANYSEIANRTGKARECVRAYIRRHSPEFEGMKRIKVKPIDPDMPPEDVVSDGFPVGIFSDTHIPFDHPNYLQFIVDTFAKYKVGQVICLGDLVDNHAISRHQTEACAKSPYDELDASIARVAEFVKAFPTVKMCKGNHDLIHERQAATIGMGDRYLKSFSELFDLPDTWIIKTAFVIDDVLYKHGINCLGKEGAMNASIKERMSTVIGHSHSYGGVQYSANHRNIIFGMNTGCGIDCEAYAFAYGQYFANRPTLGCGIVFNSANAIFVPMGKEYFRN